jgi:ABC-2 type transport system permease protein
MEMKLLLREPIVLVFGVALPVVLLAVFGNLSFMKTPDPGLGGVRIIDVYLPPLISVTITMLGLSTISAVLSNYRERGILKRLATTPAKPMTLLLAEMAVNLFLMAVTVALLLVVGVGLMGIKAPKDFVGFVIAFLLAAAAVFSIGLLVAAWAPNGRTGSGLGSILFFPLVFFAGLWTPGPAMPALLRQIALFTPLGAGSQAMQLAWDGNWWQPLRLGVMVAYTVGCCFGASKLFRWTSG